MDKTTKFILGLIAVALIGINIQMWNGKTGLIKEAQAKTQSVYIDGHAGLLKVICVDGCGY